jgi:DNA repair exonuclease SbcCD ATPase subunit
MRLISLSLSGYRQFAQPVTIALPGGLTGVCGPNGVGKSKLVEAISFALYGPRRGLVLPSGDSARDLASKAIQGAAVAVELQLEVRGQRFTVKRTSSAASITAETGEVLAETPSGVTKKVTELLRLTPEAFQGTFVARQRDVAGLQGFGPQERTRLVNRLLGITQVEKALELARERKGKRSEELNVAVAKLRRTAAEEQETVTAAEKALESARALLEERQGEAAAARQSFEAQERLVAELRTGVELAQRLEHQIRGLEAHQATLRRELERATTAYEDAIDAAVGVESARALVTETEGTEAAVARLELLTRREGLLGRMAELERAQTDLRQKSAEREELSAEASALEERLTELAEEIARLQEDSAAARQTKVQADEAAETVKAELAAAKELGPKGRCRVCGQRYGDSFQAAVSHFDQELADTESRSYAAAAKLAEIEGEVEELTSAQEGTIQRLGEMKQSLTEVEEVPGELSTVGREIERTKRDIESLGVGNEPYDPEAHSEALRRQEERQAARQLIERLEPVAQTVDGLKEAITEIEVEQRDLESRKTELAKQLSKQAVKAADLGTAGVEASRLRGELESREQAVNEANDRVGAARSELQNAERELEAAERAETGIREAQRRLLVADRTTELLGRLLEEITGEARPRLAEMMEEWGRTLLGPRLQRIDLTTDYKIRADNGSGLHEISHFSGGEQTILSVMLRVAISLFCRERAGFDTGFLILDEVFGDQDGEHRVQLVEFLSEIQRQYHQILVVNHVDDVTALLDSIIDVTPTGLNTSTAAIRS